MGRLLLLILFSLCPICTLVAQKIQVLDGKNNPVAFAGIRSEDGSILGYTDIDGFLPDIQNQSVIYISHLAFSPTKVELDHVQNGIIRLKESVIALKEVDIKSPKVDYIHIRCFYRVCLSVAAEIKFFDMGIADYFIDTKKKTEETHLLTNVNYSKLVYYDALESSIPPELGTTSTLEHLRADSSYAFSKENHHRQDILKLGNLVGRIVDEPENHLYRLELDREKIDSVNYKSYSKNGHMASRNLFSNTVCLFRRNAEQDYTSMIDFISETNRWTQHSHTEKGQIDFVLDGYAIEKDYLTKKEMKKKKREKINEMTYQQLQQFRAAHQIPDMDEKLKKNIENYMAKLAKGNTQ